MWGSFRLGDGHIEFGKLQIPGLFVPRRHAQSLNLAPRLAARPRRLFAAGGGAPPLAFGFLINPADTAPKMWTGPRHGGGRTPPPPAGGEHLRRAAVVRC